MTDHQLALRDTESDGPVVPILLSPGISDDELKRIRAILAPPPPPPTKMNLMANPQFIEVASVLASKLEHVQYERQAATVFSQHGVEGHCNELMRTIMYGEDRAAWPAQPFHINRWFAQHRGGDLRHDPTDPLTDVRLTQFSTEMKFDWIQILIDQEMETPGFCRVLYNCLQLEERIGERLQKRNRSLMGELGSGASLAYR